MQEERARSKDALVFVNSNIRAMVVIKLGVMFQYLQAFVVRHIFVVEMELPLSNGIHYGHTLQGYLEEQHEVNELLFFCTENKRATHKKTTQV